MNTGCGIRDHGVELRRACRRRQRKAGIADAKRIVGGNKHLRILQAAGALERYIGPVAGDIGDLERKRLAERVLAGPGALIFGRIDGSEFGSERDEALVCAADA